MSDQHLNLTQTLDAIEEDTKGKDIHMPDLIEALNSRGFGPFLIGPALISILPPTGVIPFLPDVCALFFILVSAQILVGRKHPWLPKKWIDFTFNRKKFLEMLDKAKPYTKRVDKYIYPRLKFLTSPVIKPVIALQIILLSLTIPILGFIPGLAAIPATGVLLFGLGMSVRDGLLITIAAAFTLGSIIAVPLLWDTIFS